jgi:hypothetical protein
LLRENGAEIDAFLKEFADVNELQAAHVDDLSLLFKWLPTALNRVHKSFEPETGLIRFGLATDTENHACDYGTERRAPENRAKKKPPLKARCGGGGNQGSLLEGLDPGASTDSTETESDTTGGEPGALTDLLLDDVTGTPTLPARMSNWSWTLFYLNGV